jgi:peptidoglycan/xylan/chitin deacetylase (PgdA/CDA1 family)
MLGGVFILRLRMFADALVRGPKGARGAALTFDDGPDPVHTRRVLEILEKHDAHATFFLIGRKVEKHADVVREIVARGHDVGVHGFAHDRLFSLRGPRRVRRDLERAVRAVEAVTKRRPVLFRPPVGHTNPTIARIAEQLGLTVVGWSAAGYDGIARARPLRVAARVAKNLDDGVIVLLHDAAERDDHEPVGVAALPEILASMKDRNLPVARLNDWIEDDA